MKIDKEFQALIPALQPEERQQLEENLVAHGCRDPLALWRGLLIDGHNRYEICQRRGIKFRTIEVALPSREHVLLWIEENQLGRRNLRDDQRAAIAHAVKKRRAALARVERASKAGKAGGVGRKRDSLPDTASGKLKDRSLESRTAVAKAARIPERKLRAIDEIEKKAGPEAVAQIRSGDKTIAEVRTTIRRAERTEKILKLTAPPLSDSDGGTYPVLLVDPPWRYEFVETDSRAIENQYPTMSLEEIRALEVSKIAAEDAVLFLWATSPKLADAMAVITAWGFEYRTSMVWVKDKIGMGHYVRSQHELLLIAKRGAVPMPQPFDRPPSVVHAPRLEHSRKPDEFYVLIERMYPEYRRKELFTRGPARPGWDAWGNQKVEPMPDVSPGP